MLDKPERIVVTGGRFYEDRSAVFRVLDEYNPSIVIQGGCPTGVDKFVVDWARERGITVITYFAMWDLYGISAGPRRNKEMLQDSHPDLVLVFPGGKGTAGCAKLADEMGIPTRKIFVDNLSKNP